MSECTCPADKMPFGRCCKAPTSADVIAGLGVLSVMPENWREDPDWVALVEAQELTPNAAISRPVQEKP